MPRSSPRVVKQRHFESYFAEIRREKSSVSFVDRQRRKCSFPCDTLNPVLCSIAIQGPQNSMGTPRVMTRKPPNTLRWAMTRKLRIMAQAARDICILREITTA
jgi:hypothetical protein